MAEAEIVTRRRKWAAEEKAALLAEVEAEGGKVKLVARRHGISESLIYNWRSAWKMATSLRPAPPIEFVPVGILNEAGERNPVTAPGPERPAVRSTTSEDRIGRIEIDLPNGARVHVDESVSEKALVRILRALKGSM
jgi:transposase